MNDIKNQLLQLNQTSRKSVAHYHRFALSIHASDSALGVLYALLEAERPCSQYDLCSEWFIPKQTINSAVTALRRKGLISLVHIAGTRNKKSIVLTEAGREFAEKTVGRLRAAEFSALKALAPEEREMYIRLNHKYNQALSERLDGMMAGAEIERTEQDTAPKETGKNAAAERK